MSLTSALLSAEYGMQKSQNQLNVASANVANADREGYTRKQYTETNYVSVNGTSVAVQDDIERIDNEFLRESAIETQNELSYAQTVDSYMQSYDQAMGTTTGQNSLNAELDDLATSINSMAQTPENNSEAFNVIQAAEDLTYQLNRQSSEIQDLRLQADQEIDQTVDEINQLLADLDMMNDAIVDANARGIETADLEDERLVMLEELSGLMDIQYHDTSSGRIQIYTSGGDLLLGSEPAELTFVSTGTMTSEATYPDVLSGVMLGDDDITATIRGGELGALLDVRDDVLVEEQNKLDNFAIELADEMNRIHNQGTSHPAPERYEGTSGINGTDSLAGSTGTFRVASVDDNGDLLEVNDIDMTLINTVDDLIAEINTMTNVQAFLDGDGSLVIESTVADAGVALSDMEDPAVPTPAADAAGSGQGISDYFGLNDFFDPEMSGAEDIRVNSALVEQPELLSTGSLSTDLAVVAGDQVLYSGDSSTADQLSDMFEDQHTFDSVAHVSQQNDTFQGYLSTLTASSAREVDAAANNLENATYSYDAAKTALLNFTGINVDEEMTNIIVIEDAYAASAQVMSTVQEMFDTLLDAVR